MSAQLPWHELARSYQLQAADWLTDFYAPQKGRLLADGLGTGKALALNTPIPTPSGWKTMADLKVGDEVFGADGKPCKVINTFDVPKPNGVFDVYLSDGEVIRACGDHLWLTFTNSARKALRRSNQARDGVMYGEKECVSQPRVRDTRSIAETTHGTNGREHALQMNGVLDLPMCELPLDPYLLGVWLGDGHSKEGAITVHVNEESIAQAFHAFEPRKSKVKGNAVTWRFNRDFTAHLRRLNVYRNKHVPDQYLWASEVQRLNLLQGLMDTDGTISASGTCTFDNTNEQLVDSVLFLCASLGIKATKSVKYPKVTGRPEAVCKPCYRAHFTTTKRVFRHSAFKEGRLPWEVRSTAKWRYIDRVVKVDSTEPMKCITVGSLDSLYLCGKSLVVTHNTRSALAAMRMRFDKGLIENPTMLCFTTASATHDWKREASRFWPELKVVYMGARQNVSKRKSETPEEFEQRKLDAVTNAEWRKVLKSPSDPVLLVGDYWWSDVVGDAIMDEFDVLIDSLTLDECFVPGTLVQTPSGPRRIETLNPGELVLGFDPVTGHTEPVVVRATRQTYAERILELVFQSHIIKTTPNHPFLTVKGWKRADELQEGDEVVCVVQEAPREGTEPEGTLLRHELLREVANETTLLEGDVRQHEVSRISATSMDQAVLGIEGEARSGVVASHEAREPNASQGGAEARLEDPQSDRAQATFSGRQRETSLKATRDPRGSSGLGDGVHHRDEERVGPPEPHQGGHREPGDEGGRGGGRLESLIAQGEGGRPSQGSIPSGTRLVRLQSVQSRRLAEDVRGHAVHNLEVSGAHTYLVTPLNIVVHNCHLVKKSGTRRSQAIKKLVNRSLQTTMLTGTPVHNRPYDLHNLLRLCDPRAASPSVFGWAKQFFEIKLNDGNYETIGGLRYKDALMQSIRPYIWGRTAAELMGEDLPARTFQLKAIDVAGAVRMSPAKLRAKGTAEVDALLREMVRHKFEACVEVLRDADKPAVVYTYRREDAVKLKARIEREGIKCTLATGDQTNSARDKAIELWKLGEGGQVLVCTMDAVRESATLVRADLMLFVDLHWLPATILQCMGRIDPARQPENERRPVLYVFLTVKGGPDEVVAEVLAEKIREASGIGVKNQFADKMADFLSPVDERKEAQAIKDPKVMMETLVARLNARADRLADLGML